MDRLIACSYFIICPGKNENFITNPGARSRYISRHYADNYNKQEGKLENTFKFKGVITKIVLKTSPWQNEVIIQGMRFYFNDGKIRNIGILKALHLQNPLFYGTLVN